MVSADIVATVGLNAISAIFVLSVVALGLGIIFGFMGVINLTHGSFVMLGAYTVWLIDTNFGLGFWVGFVLAPVALAGIGYLVEVFLISFLYDRLIDTLLATWGLAMAFREAVRIVFGRSAKEVSNPFPGGVDLGITVYPKYRLFLIVLSIAILGGVYLLFYRTNLGVRIRAVIQDPDAAELLGLNRTRMNRFTYAFGSALAGLGGAAIGPIKSIQPGMGLTYLADSFFAVIVGGAGTVTGVIYGSSLVAGLNEVLSFNMSSVVAQTVVYVLVIVFIAIRPTIAAQFAAWRES